MQWRLESLGGKWPAEGEAGGTDKGQTIKGLGRLEEGSGPLTIMVP